MKSTAYASEMLEKEKITYLYIAIKELSEEDGKLERELEMKH